MIYDEKFVNTECPVARVVGILGDKWSLMILRDAFDGIRRFSDLQKSTGAAKNILADRLKNLVNAEILELKPAANGSAYSEYHLTEKGRGLFPVIVSLRQWGEENMFATGETHSVLVDGQSGQKLEKLLVRDVKGNSVDSSLVIRKRVVKKKG